VWLEGWESRRRRFGDVISSAERRNGSVTPIGSCPLVVGAEGVVTSNVWAHSGRRPRRGRVVNGDLAVRAGARRAARPRRPRCSGAGRSAVVGRSARVDYLGRRSPATWQSRCAVLSVGCAQPARRSAAGKQQLIAPRGGYRLASGVEIDVDIAAEALRQATT